MLAGTGGRVGAFGAVAGAGTDEDDGEEDEDEGADEEDSRMRVGSRRRGRMSRTSMLGWLAAGERGGTARAPAGQPPRARGTAQQAGLKQGSRTLTSRLVVACELAEESGWRWAV